jgi:hypothetical protein
MKKKQASFSSQIITYAAFSAAASAESAYTTPLAEHV